MSTTAPTPQQWQERPSRRPRPNWHSAHRAGLTRGQRAADRLRDDMGSWTFIGLFLAAMAIWAVINAFDIAWDPYPYILLNLFLSMLAGLQGAILLIAAKRQDAIAAALAQHDFDTDASAKVEIDELLRMNRRQLLLIEQLITERIPSLTTNGEGIMDVDDDAIVSSLDEDHCWKLLERGRLGRLAVAFHGEPDIFPVNYVVDGRRLLFRTAPGSKLAQLAVNPRVAFEVDEFDDTFAASVVVRGDAERLESQREIDAADALGLAPWIPTLKYRWVQITATEIAGRRFLRVPEPDRYAESATDA